jgi:hypothetical protein
MDATQLAQLAATTLTPALPVLLKIGEGTLTKIGEDFKDAVSKKLCEKFWPRLAQNPAALEAANDAAAAPNDADAQAAFRRQVKKLLEADPDFAQEIAALLPAASGASTQNVPINGNAEQVFTVQNLHVSGDFIGKKS